MAKKMQSFTKKNGLLDRKVVQQRLTATLTELREYYGGEEALLESELQKVRNNELGVLADLKVLMWARGQLEVYADFQD